ncbi:GNAT family N-acetyltransferase [Bacillus sp. JJ664]
MNDIQFSPFPNLSTNRLILRQMKNEDKEAIFALRSDKNVSEFIDRPIASSIDDATEYIKMINDGIEQNKWILWAIMFKDSDDLIGTICLWNFLKEQSKGEVGYELSPIFQGKGIMQEALLAVIAFGFEDLKLRIIEGIVNEKNAKSIQLLEKNQFFKNETIDKEKSISIIYTLKR